jgi:hypothetical protein
VRTKDSNGLRLRAVNVSGDENPVIWRSSNILTQKLIFPVFETVIGIDVSGLLKGERAGICMMGGQYVTAYFEKGDNDELLLKIAESKGGDADKIEVIRTMINVADIGEGSRFEFKMIFSLEKTIDSEKLYFQNVHKPFGGANPCLRIEVKAEKGDFKDTGVCYTPSDHTWVGAKIGIFAISGNRTSHNGYADFLYVRTKEL